MTSEPKDLNDQDDFLNTDQNERPQDINNSDSGKFTEDEEEQALADGGEFSDSRTVENFEAVGGDAPPLTTQGDDVELEQNLGGTTNLSLDQLKHNHHKDE